MSPMSGLGTGVTRRIAQSPQMRKRIQTAVEENARQVHARRFDQWSRTNQGSFPKRADSAREAIEELAILCSALGSLIEITPRQIDHALWLMNHPDGRDNSDQHLWDWDKYW